MAELELGADTLDGCRRGDPQAERRFFERYRESVYSIALHFLKGDDAGAEDVTQEVFVKVFRAIPSFRHDGRISTWLYRIVANACMDEMRRRRRFLSFGNVSPALHPAVPAAEPTGFDTEVTRAVARLSPKLRIAVLLRYFEDLSYEEIAETLELTKGTVASRLNRAHAVLARELAHLRSDGPGSEERNHVQEA